MRQIREFRSNFENILRDCRAMVTRLSHDSRATFVRVSHDFPANVTYFHLNSYDSRASVARHWYECRLVLFSRQIVGRFSQDCHATLAKISHCKFAKISRRQVRDTRTNVAGPSHDSRATVLRNILEKKLA